MFFSATIRGAMSGTEAGTPYVRRSAKLTVIRRATVISHESEHQF